MSSLAPTEGAHKQHSYCAYHKVHLRLGNELPADYWGWERRQDCLVPVTTKDSVAPQEVLNTIFCKWTTGCGDRCQYRKTAIYCTKQVSWRLFQWNLPHYWRGWRTRGVTARLNQLCTISCSYSSIWWHQSTGKKAKIIKRKSDNSIKMFKTQGNV